MKLFEDFSKILKKHSDKKEYYLKRKLNDNLASKITELNLPYIYFIDEFSRVYLGGSYFSNIIGFTDIDDNGQAGIEYSKNNEKLIHDAFELLCEEEVIASESVKEIEGLQEVIDYLLSKKYSISLVTMQCKKSANIILAKLNLTGKFSSIITRDENYDRFFQIKNTCESLNFSPSDVTMIGDRIHDINSATKANCNSILVNRNDIKSKKLKELMNIL